LTEIAIARWRRQNRVDRMSELRRRLAHRDIDGLATCKREALQIGRKLDRVMDGNVRLRQLARRGL
jgi:hypothetical protein